ncbi:MAG: 6-phosphogluconate dehydrogenase [Rhodospirillaceae bacterium]|nr:6-phosphogluconate dehydrogenase [Rhodospirillaceae bacterium]
MSNCSQEIGSRKIGFIGVGLMGTGMVQRLLAAGHETYVLVHKNRVPIEKVCKMGAIHCDNVSDLAARVEFIFLCLPSSSEVTRIAKEISRSRSKANLVIDCTTNSPGSLTTIHEIFSNANIEYLEAPLTGGVTQAERGQLGAILGGTKEAVKKARPLLSACCSEVVHVGPVGMGANTKLVSNFLALGTATLVVESLHIAKKLGINWQSFYDLARQGSGHSMSLDRIAPKAIQGDYKGYMFSITNTAKDFRYINDLFMEKDIELSKLAKWMLKQYEDAETKGLGNSVLSQRLDPALMNR